MNVSQEHFLKIQELFRQLDEHLKTPSTDNRHAPRLNVRTPLTVMLLTGAGAIPVEIFSRNLSDTRIGFVSRRMFTKEERIAVALKIPKLPAKLILSRITFGRYVNAGHYEMGAEFLECISDPKGNASVPRQWLVTSYLQPKPAAPSTLSKTAAPNAAASERVGTMAAPAK